VLLFEHKKDLLLNVAQSLQGEIFYWTESTFEELRWAAHLDYNSFI